VAKTKAPADEPQSKLRVRRFDADRQDREIDLKTALRADPSKRQLLWIDGPAELPQDEVNAIAKRFEFDPKSLNGLEGGRGRPDLTIHGGYFQLSLATPGTSDRGTDRPRLDIVARDSVVVTRHDEPLALLDELDSRVKEDSELGAATGPALVALILDAVVSRYFGAVDDIEDAIDELDARSLRSESRREMLEELVALRRRISRLRQTVAAHRTMFAALAGPDVQQVVEEEHAIADLRALGARFDALVVAVESSREALLGSFEVYMTRTAQRTNEVMKVLTLATVLLLPGSLIAGLLGMNVNVPLDKNDPNSFWIVVVAIAALALVITVVARARRWL
jgi:Mg2+ and Co2+ transporter CorA